MAKGTISEGLAVYNRNRQIQKAAGNLDIKGIVKVLGAVNRAAQLRLKDSKGTITMEEIDELNQLEAANTKLRHQYQEKARKEKALKERRAKEWAARQEKNNAPPTHTLADQLKTLLK